MWGEVVANWDLYYKKKPRRLAELVQLGVPPPVRTMVWPLLARSRPPDGPPDATIALPPERPPAALYVTLLQEASTHEKHIVRDLARTYPEHALFAEAGGAGQGLLYNVIKAFSNYDREVGYCQGSPFIAGALLVHLPEEDAFGLFCALMRQYGLRGLFRPSMADLPLRLHQLGGLVQAMLPGLHAHLAELGVEAASYAAPMFLTLFATVLPLGLVCRVVDVFLLEGLPALFRFALGILAERLDVLLRAGFEDTMRLLAGRTLREHYSSDDAQARLLATVGRIAVAPKRLAALEKDFRAHKAREEQAQSELATLRDANARLEADNRALRERVAVLEAESGVLARRLVEAQSRLQQSEDRVDDLVEEKRSQSRASQGSLLDAP